MEQNARIGPPDQPLFWRDGRMPYVELRVVQDGRKVCYAPHSHVEWSMGAIINGESTFAYRDDAYRVNAGTLVLMNPHWVHACNPIDNQPWAYTMLYVDKDWLTQLRYEAGLLEAPLWQDIMTATIKDEKWYVGYCDMAACLLDSTRTLLEKQSILVEFLTNIMTLFSGQLNLSRETPAPLQKVADYLRAQACEDVSLDSLCNLAGYSPGHLIRSFKKQFGLTPHAYLLNCRVQQGQRALKRGESIADTAVDVGFSDQSHFQRTFKKLLAATPNQYRRSLVHHDKDTASSN
ncbi:MULTISPECIES: AraC family transcriptional regulator [Salinivibrio]|uniref:AraC family transcriptional regulator n=1 Tax=Salinivibrio siamensis TaxID=414286 RepID=A0ABX3K6Z7_9GAMM|nr:MULTISPECIES: AraC family transcriptional regulator [Salinivibrio]KKA45573.1 AraC family transcriptional regulator [Salinivibrio sp. KP-1]OOE78310.1 AraC family transcriptional regulator [Salinivibrio sp. ML198]OOE83206.1 AraC family transcriptional regulator [Salinivibrio siamensis]